MDKKVSETIWSYCVHCWECHDFHLKNDTYVCEKCKKPLVRASASGTKVTQEVMYGNAS